MDTSHRYWRCGKTVFRLDSTLVMGILNVTPDSFSDGGSYADSEEAISRGMVMVAEGAHIIDVGGESSRPGAWPVSPLEEARRVIPVIAGLASRGVVVSIDTRNSIVARAAIDAGASIVNDITGFSSQEMVDLAATTQAGLVVMHMSGSPTTMQANPTYEDVYHEVRDYLIERAVHLLEAGVDPCRICIDPGFGFGKTTEHNIEILRRSSEFAATGFPLMAAVSRKRTIGELSGVEDPAGRVLGSIAAALFAVGRGASVVRVHDVAPTVEALKVFDRLVRE